MKTEICNSKGHFLSCNTNVKNLKIIWSLQVYFKILKNKFE